jgi:hypothetical protein
MVKLVYNIVNFHDIKGLAGLLLSRHVVAGNAKRGVITRKNMPGESPDRMMTSF